MGFATEAQAAEILAALRQRDEERQRLLPTTLAALEHMQVGRERLRAMGWRDGIYCPKDGTPFAAIQFGSTGIFIGRYAGIWPTQGYVVVDGCVSHPDGLLWKPRADLDADERAHLDQCMARERDAAARELDGLLAFGHGDAEAEASPTPAETMPYGTTGWDD